VKAALLLIAAAALALAGCAEREQTAKGVKSDAQAYQGTNRPQPFMAAGWKAGDRDAWEQHLKVRTQRGQNEYNKID
jgi:hypothetical protein